MPANEFEKQVQKQLDDFQLNPSASVWKKVEEQIRKKKRRRVIFFILLPMILGILGYSVYQFSNTRPKTELQPVATSDEKSLTKETRAKQRTINAGEDQLQIASNNPSTGHRKNKTAGKQDDKIATGQKESRSSQVINSNVQAKDEMAVTIDKPATGTVTKNEIAKETVQETSDPKVGIVVTPKDPVAEKTDSAGSGDVVKTINSQETIEKKKTGGVKINWGIDVFAGIASNQSKPLSFTKSYDAVSFYNGAASSAGAPPATANPPSSIRSGPAFRLGIVGELQVSQRSRFSAGLQYVYAANTIKTGTGVDTTVRLSANFSSMLVDRLYRGPQQNDYTNSYHFVSLPLSYHWQINKSKTLPIQWNFGVSFSYLLATNALIYSPSYGGIYYQDKGAINKAHFNIGTGLSFRVKGKKGMEWVLGPEISFDTRKLLNDGYHKEQYLLFGGINTKLFFPKKKNK